MGSTAVEKAALVGGVIAAADPTGLTGIFHRAAAATSNTILNITSAMQGKWINFYAKSTDVQYAFATSGNGAVLTYNPDVTAGTGLGTAGATIPAGVIVPVLVPTNATKLSFIAESATGKVEIYVSETLSGGK